MNFSLELIFFILNHPVTSKQPRKIVQILNTYGSPCIALIRMALFSNPNYYRKEEYAKLFERIKLTIYNGFHIPTK